MIITNVDNNDLESIFSIQESVFKEEPLLTGLDYFKQVASLDDLKDCFEKYDFLKAVDDDGSITGLICAKENNNTVSIPWRRKKMSFCYCATILLNFSP